MAKSNLGKEGFISSLQLHIAVGDQGSQAGTQGLKLKQKPRRSAAYWSAPRELLNLLS